MPGLAMHTLILFVAWQEQESMQLHELNAQTWVIQGGGNIGIVAYENRCLLIDSGLDKDAGRDILKLVKKLGLTPTALLVTHAHVDHFGGAHYLVNQTGLKVYATRIEAAVMSSPILEPLYLFGGAQPPRELQHKFLLAKPSPADVLLAGNETSIDGIPLRVLSLPGHSLEQVGIAFGETMFVGDAFLVPEILNKHRIPFYSDVQSGLATLTALTTQTAAFRYVVRDMARSPVRPSRLIAPSAIWLSAWSTSWQLLLKRWLRAHRAPAPSCCASCAVRMT
jgi:glyoxylase-like metal-dependent hydrolase (beta-lactamase superfamily II)